jgi:flagellar biosynthesis/type III secretory pathway protein FliH
LERDDYYNKGKEEGYSTGEAYGRASERLKMSDALEKVRKLIKSAEDCIGV